MRRRGPERRRGARRAAERGFVALRKPARTGGHPQPGMIPLRPRSGIPRELRARSPIPVGLTNAPPTSSAVRSDGSRDRAFRRSPEGAVDRAGMSASRACPLRCTKLGFRPSRPAPGPHRRGSRDSSRPSTPPPGGASATCRDRPRSGARGHARRRGRPSHATHRHARGRARPRRSPARDGPGATPKGRSGRAVGKDPLRGLSRDHQPGRRGI
jgi:hypothetical protein